MVLVTAGAMQYFRPLSPRLALTVALAAAALPLAASGVNPAAAGMIGTAEQAAVLLTAAGALVIGRKRLKAVAPRSFAWLIVVCAAGALHALGFIFVYARSPNPLSTLGTLLLTTVALLFFLYLEVELTQRALVKSNERFRATFEQAAVGIIHVDPNQRFLRVNQRFCDLVGYSREELLGSRTVDDVTHPDERERSATFLAQVTSGEHGDYTIEKRYLRKDGSVFWGAVTVSAVRRHDGSLEYLIAVVRDVTERKQLEAELASHRAHLEELVAERTKSLWTAYRDLERANRAKSEFLSKMSHELRTPLNSIIGFTSMILSGLTGPLNDEQEHQLGMVKSSGKHLLSLVDDVLDIDSIESGHEEMLAERCDVCCLIDDAVELARPLANEKSITLIINCDIPDSTCDTDPQAIGQVLRSLLDNAIKFTSSGGEVKVVAHTTPDSLSIEVKDNGCGIAEDDVERVFEPFEKAGAPRDAALIPGAGLGLSIASRIAELLGGALHVQSTPGAGSTFTLEVPRYIPRMR
jgi:PAS domain S-box-containing protein